MQAQDLNLQRPCRIFDDRLRLRGTPGELVGVASVARAAVPTERFKICTNDVAETEFGYQQRLRFAPLVSTTMPIGKAVPRALVFGSMPPPEAEGRVMVRFATAQTTPPGHYEAVFDVGGEQQVADIEVLPVEQLGIAPRSIAVAGSSGAVVHEEIILTNLGNVTIDIDLLGVLVLQEEEQVCLSLQRALGKVKASSEGEPHKVFLDALTLSLAERKTEFARVRIADGAIKLPPGDSRHVRIAIDLPKDMTAGRSYRALLKAYGAQLFVTIEGRGGHGASRKRTTAEG